ncbi:MAG: hypothetical protein MUF38_17125 [Anaerolineae bacterium]|nr:hypothetical protein [Anaerolineae bacterium]
MAGRRAPDGDERLTAHAQVLYAHLAYRGLRNTGDADDAERALGHIETAFIIYQGHEDALNTLRTTLLAREVCLALGDAEAAARSSTPTPNRCWSAIWSIRRWWANANSP